MRISLASLGLVLVVAAGFMAGAYVDHERLLPWPTADAQENPPDIGIFREAWDVVQQHYVDRSALQDPTKLMYGAIDGLLSSLGDVGHTRFLSPDDLKAEQDALSGKLEGIGAEVARRGGRIVIVAPIAGSPAQKAGIRPGDTIMRVNGQDVSEAPLEQVVNMVRGPAGTSVTLTVVHPDESSLTDITVVRQQLTVPSVSWAMEPGTTVAHILVSEFADHTSNDLVSAIDDARKGGATSIALDLRNDPGGIRDEAIAVASQFLNSGNVLLEQDANGHQTPYPVKPGGVAYDVPLVVLINEGTASSAEIVAGAIQDDHRATLVGQTTFGTGTVLSTYRLSDGSAILLGTSEWLTPDGREIWHHGISPDVSVALPSGAFPRTPEEEKGETPEQIQSSQDTQLNKAIQILTQAGG